MFFELKDFEVNPTDNREGHVADGYAARSAPFERPRCAWP